MNDGKEQAHHHLHQDYNHLLHQHHHHQHHQTNHNSLSIDIQRYESSMNHRDPVYHAPPPLLVFLLDAQQNDRDRPCIYRFTTTTTTIPFSLATTPSSSSLHMLQRYYYAVLFSLPCDKSYVQISSFFMMMAYINVGDYNIDEVQLRDPFALMV